MAADWNHLLHSGGSPRALLELCLCHTADYMGTHFIAAVLSEDGLDGVGITEALTESLEHTVGGSVRHKGSLCIDLLSLRHIPGKHHLCICRERKGIRHYADRCMLLANSQTA